MRRVLKPANEPDYSNAFNQAIEGTDLNADYTKAYTQHQQKHQLRPKNEPGFDNSINKRIVADKVLAAQDQRTPAVLSNKNYVGDMGRPDPTNIYKDLLKSYGVAVNDKDTGALPKFFENYKNTITKYPGGAMVKDKTGNYIYKGPEQVKKEQIKKAEKNNPSIFKQISKNPTFQEWVDTEHKGYSKFAELATGKYHAEYIKKYGNPWEMHKKQEQKKIHEFINTQNHEKRMAKAEQMAHKDGIIGTVLRHADALALPVAESAIGLIDFIPNLIGNVAKGTKFGKKMQTMHEGFEMAKQKIEEHRAGETSDTKNPYLKSFENAAQGAIGMMAEMGLLGKVDILGNVLADAGAGLMTKQVGKKGLKLVANTAGKLISKVAQVENKFKLATNFGYFGTKSSLEYFKSHNDMVEDLEKNGIPKDASPEEVNYYKNVLKNKGDIKRNALLMGLVNGASFSAFHGMQIGEKLLAPLTKKFGGKVAREYLAKTYAEGAEASGFKKFMLQKAAQAGQAGVDVGLPVAGGAATFALIGTVPGIAEHIIEKNSFNKEWTWKQVGNEALHSALTGALMGVPQLVAGVSSTGNTIKSWKSGDTPSIVEPAKEPVKEAPKTQKKSKFKNEVKAHFDEIEKVNNGATAVVKAFQSEQALETLTDKLTTPQKVKAIELAKSADWKGLDNITKKMKPEDAENFRKYVVETKTADDLLSKKIFDHQLYEEFSTPLKEITNQGGTPYEPSTRASDIVGELKSQDGTPHYEMANNIVSTINERQDVKPAIKDAVTSFILQHYKYGTEGMDNMKNYLQEHSEQFQEVLSGETEANQQRGKDFHALLSDIVKGKRSMQLYDKQDHETTKNVYDKILEAIEKHGELGTQAEKKALTLAAVEDLVSQMNNHYKQCLDVTSRAGIDKAIDFFKKHQKEFVNTENAFSYEKLKHFMGEEKYEELMNSLAEKELGIEQPPVEEEIPMDEIPQEEMPQEEIPQDSTTSLESAQMEELPAGIEKEPEQDGDVLPQTSELEGQQPPMEEEDTPDNVEKSVSQSIEEEIMSVEDPHGFVGLSDSAYAEYIHDYVFDYAQNKDEGFFMLKNSAALERLNYDIKNNMDADTHSAHFENSRLGIEYSINFDKETGEYELISKGETIATGQTFNDITKEVFDFLGSIQDERAPLKIQGEAREPLKEKIEREPIDEVKPFTGEKATVYSTAPKIDRLEREHNRANSPVYPNEHFQKGEIVLSDNWRDVRDMQGNINGENYAIMEDGEALLKDLFNLPNKENRLQAIEELKNSNKALWDKLVEIVPLKYACEAGNYFIHDDFMGNADKSSAKWELYRENREKILENVIANGGRLGNIKVERKFANITKGEIRSIKGTKMSEVGKIYKDGQNIVIEHNGAKVSLLNKLLGHKYDMDGDDVDVSNELANLILSNAQNGNNLVIDENNCSDYGIKVKEPVKAKDIIDLFYQSKLNPSDGSRGYIHVDFDNKTVYTNAKDAEGLHQRGRGVTSDNSESLRMLAELQEKLALRPIDIDPKNLNKKMPFSIEMGDFKAEKGQSIKDVLLDNGFLLSNNDIDQPYRDTSLQMTFEPERDELLTPKEVYEEITSKPGNMEPKLTATPSEVEMSHEERYEQKQLEKAETLIIPDNLRFRASSVYENTRNVHPESQEERARNIVLYRNMLSEKTGGTLSITNDNRTPFRQRLEQSSEGYKPAVKDIVDLFEENGQPHYFHACMSLDGAVLYNKSASNSLFHEAFHRVSLLYLKPEERARVYEEARNEFKYLKNVDDAKVEEFLAEQFRDKVANSEVNIIKGTDGMVMKTLRSMWEFVQQYVLGIAPKVDNIKGLMENIANGKYKYVRPDSESIREFKLNNPDNYVGFESNGTVFPAIPNKQTYDNIVKSMANRVLERVGDITNATNAEEFIQKGVESTFAYDIEDHTNNPKEDSERAIAYREDLMHEDGIKTFVRDIINHIKSKSGAKKYLDSFQEGDDIGATLRYAHDADKVDPYSRCNDRLMAVIDNLKGDYDPELTMTKYHSQEEVRGTIMQKLGGKFHDMEGLKKLLEKEANDPTSPTVMKSLYDNIINDDGLLNSAYTMFNLDKVNYKDIKITKDGNVKTSDSVSTEKRTVMSQWTGRLEDMRNMDKEYLNNVSKDITLLKDTFTKNLSKASFEDYANGIVEGLSKTGMDIDKETLIAAARDMVEAEYPGEDIPEEQRGELFKQVLNDYLSQDGSNVFHELQRIWQTAKGGCRDSYSRTYGNQYLVKFENIARGDSPALNRLAELMTRYGKDYSSSSVMGPDGKMRFSQREPSYFGDMFKKHFRDENYINLLKQDERLSANKTLHSGRVADLKASEALTFRGDGNTENDYSNISPKESFLTRLETSAMRQISDKGRMPIVEGIMDHYESPEELLKTHGLAEISTRLTARSVRGGFVRDMLGLTKDVITAKDITAFDDLSGAKQQELLKGKSLKDYGMVEGYHYKYVKETDSSGKLTGWKVKLDGGGYKGRFFGHLDEHWGDNGDVFLADTTKDLEQIARKIVSDEKVLKAHEQHLEQYLQKQLDKGYEVGALPKIDLKELDPNNISEKKVEEWNTSFEAMCDRFVDSEDPRLVQFREEAGIQSAEDLRVYIQENGTDFPVPMGVADIPFKKLGLEGIGKFFKEYGESPTAEIEQKSEALKDIKEKVMRALVRDLEINELIEGDPAFSGGYNNQTKRISGMFSTGKHFVSEFPPGHPLEGRTRFRKLNVHDAIIHNEADWNEAAERRAKALYRLNPEGKTYEEYLSQAKEETKGIRDVMNSDGQSFMSPSMAREMQIRLGLWTEAQQAAYEDLKAFINGTSKGIKGKTLISPVMKCMNWERKSTNQLLHDGSSKVLTGYEFQKTAYAPLLVYDREHPMFKVLKHMEDNDIGVLGFGSTTKTWGTDKVQLWDGDGNLMDQNLTNSENFITDHGWDDMRWQLQTDPHGNKPRKLGIQAMKVLFDVSDKNVTKKMHESISNIARVKMGEAFGGEMDKIASKIVSKGLSSTDITDNSVEAIMQGVDISKLRNPNITKSILQGVSSSLETSTNGGSLVQVSNIGRSKLNMNDGKGRTEVAVNMRAIEQYLPKGTSHEEAQRILDKINSDCGGASLLLYRVPTQGVTSMFHGVVKELVHDSAGDVIFTPEGIQAKIGSDYDVDKLYFASKTLVTRGNEKFKPSEEVLSKFIDHINSSKIVDSANEKGVGRLRDRMDFDYVKEAHKFALDNYAVYDEDTDTFKTIAGGKKAYFDNVKYEELGDDNESVAGYGNQYLDSAFEALAGDGADLASTSSVDGPVSHAKELLNKISPVDGADGIMSLGVAAQVDNRANNLGGQENIGAYALASSMKAIYEEGKTGSIVPVTEKPIGLKFLNTPLDLPDYISRPDRGKVFNKQGRPISDDLVAHVSLAVDSSKDPIMLSGNNNKYTNKACALLLLEGHGDAAPALIANPIVREFVKNMETGETGKDALPGKKRDKAIIEAIQKYSDIDIIPKDANSSREAAQKFEGYFMKKIETLGDKVMDPDWLIKQNEKYKEYIKNDVPIEEWDKKFKDDQVAILAQFVVASGKASELGKKLAINQLDSKLGNNYAQFYTMMKNLNRADISPNEYFDPIQVLQKLNNDKGTNPYYKEKAKAAMETIAKLRASGIVDFSEPFMNTYDYIVNTHMKNFGEREKSMNDLHSSMVRSSYAIAFDAIGMKTESLYKGKETVWDQFMRLNDEALLDPTNPFVKYLLKSTSFGQENSEGTKVLKLDLKDIESRKDEQAVMQGIRDLKSFANSPKVEKFINDYITYSYIAGGKHVAPHLIPPEMIDAHDGIRKAVDYLNVIDDYDLTNAALRHATLDKYSAMGTVEFGEKNGQVYAKGINMDKSFSEKGKGVISFNTKPTAKKPEPFIVAKTPDGEKRVYRLIHTHEGEVTDKGETKYVSTYTLAPSTGERFRDGYIAGVVDRDNDRRLVNTALNQMYGHDIPPRAKVNCSLLEGDVDYDPFVDKVLWSSNDENKTDNVPSSVTEDSTTNTDKLSEDSVPEQEFTTVKNRDVLITDEDVPPSEGRTVLSKDLIEEAVTYAKKIGDNKETFKEILKEKLDSTGELVLPDGVNIPEKYQEALSEVLEPYGIDVASMGDTAYFEVAKSYKPNNEHQGPISDQHLGILADGANELKNMSWKELSDIDNVYSKLIDKDDYNRVKKNGLLDIIATFAANDGFPASSVADAMGMNIERVNKALWKLKDDPVVLKLINTHYDEPISSKLFSALPETAQKSIIESMFNC